MVEFALVLPVMILIILGMIEYSRAYYSSSLLQNAAREGARYGILHPDWVDDADNADPDNVTARTQRFIAGLNMNNLTITVSYPDGNTSRGSRLRVQVTYPYQSIVPFLNNYTLRGQSTMHIEA
ncbi:MAG: hypothetical protein AUJ92_03425 [Armatimonadetes bacterium CG2_30_59_28]|nr:MAG: hypothetical protein AUJ92_03425 [Armatimonadetes bacterium CG2_30_59_28]